ncbi:unnamed protein product [Chrysoparadoxa australica]
MSQEDGTTKKAAMPTWKMPSPLPNGGLIDFWDQFYPLKVYNSLTRTKVPFVPMDPNRVLWYMCGPTVYDVSHMGHARTYLQFDILRRIMTDYFGYNVVLVMNITDIDDKIILRANERGIPFRELASHFEADFLGDMKALGVRQADITVRVSECIPEILAYIEKIIANGYGYESNGSVYFGVDSFHKKNGHTYAKLLPEGLGNGELLAEGEGALSVGQGDKRSNSDFALWKASKEGEPSWPSPWGSGRPGWHIECSVMASKTFEMFGEGSMDIHSGGIDLRFPHHDNEMAQAEACYDCPAWVKYFIHSGHLNIKGLKMSKSLKNFISIKEAIELHGARQIRLLFLLHKYNAGMDYSDDTMAGAIAAERFYVEFFHNVKGALRAVSAGASIKLGAEEIALVKKLEASKAEVREALCNDFDTPAAMYALQDLAKAVNKYMQDNDGKCVSQCLSGPATFVTKILKIFGVITDGPTLGGARLCLGMLSHWSCMPAGDGEGSGSREETLGPLLDTLNGFRNTVRNSCRAGDNKGILAACDSVRDEALPPLGVRLEDKGEQAVWKLEDPAVLIKEVEQKALEKERKAQAKAEAQAKAQQLKEEQEAKDKIPPQEMFKTKMGADGKPEYSAFDENGIPTHSASGEELGKSAKKKVKSFWEKQKVRHEKYLAAKTTS